MTDQAPTELEEKIARIICGHTRRDPDDISRYLGDGYGKPFWHSCLHDARLIIRLTLAATSLQNPQTSEPVQNLHPLPEATANGHTMFGALVFQGFGLPVSMVAGWIRQGQPNDKIREAWPGLTDDQIDGVRDLLELLYPAPAATSGYMQVITQPSPVVSPHSAGVFARPDAQAMLDNIEAAKLQGGGR